MSSTTASKPLVLLIDNNRDDFLLLQEACREFRFDADVELILHADAVMPRLEGAHRDQSQRPPDLILLDINLPLTDGHVILKRIKRDARFSHIPVVMYTSTLRHEYRADSMTHGAVHVATKPREFDGYGPLLSLLKDIMAVDSEPASGPCHGVPQQ